jgi:hypothetical protein
MMLDFGDVKLGETATKWLTVSSNGDWGGGSGVSCAYPSPDCRETGISRSFGARAVNQDGSPCGDCIRVTFTPYTEGSRTNWMLFTLWGSSRNNPPIRELRLNLIGTGVK